MIDAAARIAERVAAVIAALWIWEAHGSVIKDRLTPIVDEVLTVLDTWWGPFAVIAAVITWVAVSDPGFVSAVRDLFRKDAPVRTDAPTSDTEGTP